MEKRRVLLTPEDEILNARLIARREIAKLLHKRAIASGTAFILLLGITGIPSLMSTVPAPHSMIIYFEWVLDVAGVLWLVVISLALWRWQISRQRKHLSKVARPFVLTDAELQGCAELLETACDEALALRMSYRDDFDIFVLRWHGYLQLHEANLGLAASDKFTETLAGIWEIYAALHERQQRREFTQ